MLRVSVVVVRVRVAVHARAGYQTGLGGGCVDGSGRRMLRYRLACGSPRGEAGARIAKGVNGTAVWNWPRCGAAVVRVLVAANFVRDVRTERTAGGQDAVRQQTKRGGRKEDCLRARKRKLLGGHENRAE
ncbi:hypothetical protein DENSPDRAFT_450332 [Dentipellis sp. KUC8613]|nr:hypothetical protein DENSPDRAFT_450332 [Dentipellis sp. KUC8613]